MRHITPDDVERKLQSGEDISIVDVREDAEVAEGMIPGARHIPLGQVFSRRRELDKDKEHIIVCRSGHRSGLAAMMLRRGGYKAVNMEGGMLEWKGNLN